jgi:HEAT repeat protein
MLAVRRYLSGLALLMLLGPPAARAQAEAQSTDDEKLLKAAGVAVDGPGLVEFFRQRTPTADTEKRIEELMKRLGDKRFKVREQAAADLIALGPPALPSLRQTAKTAELETQRRAKHCIEMIEKRNAPEAVAAAARLLKLRRPAGALAALLAYLPSAADDAAGDVLEAVFSLGGAEGKVDPAVAAALRDAVPARRAAAALLLGRYGTPEQRQTVRQLLGDDNLTVRFRAAQGLLCGGDRSAVPALIGLLEKAPLPLAQQAEDLLTRAAGEQAPKVSLGEDAKERAKCRAVWEAWWGAHKDKVDLAKADLRSPFADTAARARTATRHFLDALMKGDLAAVRKILETPFVIDPIMVLKTRAEADNIFQQATQAPKQTPYRITKVLKMEDYRRQVKRLAGMQDTLKSLAQPGEIRAVVVESQQDGRQETAAVLVRVRGVRASVVGLGIMDAAKGLK